jgi:nitroimidazol reductase NimA-like FMN-containing flavoprotein (pyridoxamine 5'-phosphate oxidase superfamily)
MDIKMRRSEREIEITETKELLRNGEYGVLSTASIANQPYGIPLNYCYLNEDIYFHCATEGRKLKNIEENKNVSFCVVGKTEIFPETFSEKYESVIVFGKIVEVFDDEKQKGLEELLKKYYQNNDAKGQEYINKFREKTKVFKIIVENLSGKAKK